MLIDYDNDMFSFLYKNNKCVSSVNNSSTLNFVQANDIIIHRLFKITPLPVQESEHLLHVSVLSMVDFDDNIFAAGHCFDWNEHPYYKGLFCPFGYRLPPPDQGTVLVKNLAADYPYLSNTSEWFFHARKNAEKVIEKNEQFTRGK